MVCVCWYTVARRTGIFAINGTLGAVQRTCIKKAYNNNSCLPSAGTSRIMQRNVSIFCCEVNGGNGVIGEHEGLYIVASHDEAEKRRVVVLACEMKRK